MALVTGLIVFGVRQVMGTPAATVAKLSADWIETRFKDPSQALPKALAKANERAWQSLAIALAGDGLLDQIKVLFSDGSDKAIRQQLKQFLDSTAAAYGAVPTDFRKACLAELKAARKKRSLEADNISANDLAHQVAEFQRFSNPTNLHDSACKAVVHVADNLQSEYPNLAKLLREPTPAGPPLLVSAFAYFFRRAVETDDELSNGLISDGLRELAAAQAKDFLEVGKACNALGSRFNEVLGQLDRIQTVVLDTHVAVLDMQAEMQRLGGMHMSGLQEIKNLIQGATTLLDRAGMRSGEVRSQNSFSVRNDDEKRAIKELLARFRQLPRDQQEQVPALLNGLGKLQIGTGDFEGAKTTFVQVAEAVEEKSAQAEAHFNAYRAALEQKNWNDALHAAQRAAALDSQRHSLFPMQKYQPKRILGAGGFGAVFLCHERFFRKSEVVVKSLHNVDFDRSMDAVFAEAQVMREMPHPSIIRVLDCDYADSSTMSRPYIVMDYFPGRSLETYIREHGPLNVNDVLAIALQVATGMQAAHKQNIFHRDLKPDNILVQKAGDLWEVRIIDFGLALRRQTIETSLASSSAGHCLLSDSVAGTVQYAPPEQMRPLQGVKQGPHSDVYSFGKTCCYALFKTTEPKRRQLANIPDSLAELLERCTENELDFRHRSFDPVLPVLEALLYAKTHRPAITEHIAVRHIEPTEKTGFVEYSSLDDGQKTAQDYWMDGESLLDEEQYDGAIACLNEAIHIDPGFSNAYRLRGECHSKKEDYDAAIADFGEAIRLDGADAEAYARRGYCYRMNGEDEQCIADCTKAIDLNSNIAIAYWARGDSYRVKCDYNRAIGDLSQALRLDPEYIAAYLSRGEAFRKTREYRKAISDYIEYLEREPEDGLVFRSMGEAHRLIGEYGEAIDDFTEAMRLDSSIELALWGRADAYVGKGEWELAVTDCTDALHLYPGSTWCHWTRGRAFHGMGNFDKANEDFTEAIDIDPNFIHAYLDRAWLHQDNEDYEIALNDYALAMQVDPDAAASYAGSGECLLAYERWEEAIERFSTALKIDAGLMSAYRGRGTAYRRIGDFGKAISDFNEALTLDPTDAITLEELKNAKAELIALQRRHSGR